MKLRIRLITGLSMAALVVYGLIGAPVIVLSVGASIFSGLAMYEFVTMLKKKGVQVYRFFGVSMCVIIPMAVHFRYGVTRSGEVLFVVLSCFCLFLIQLARSENPKALEGISLTFFGIMYIGWFMSFLIKIRFMVDGGWLLFYLVFITKMADVGAYVVGSLWGKHPLMPHISPKKTMEGMLGGIALSAVLSVLFKGTLGIDFSVSHLLLMGTMIALIAHCGDLSESLIKRYCDVKDSGGSLPGLGGFLDIMDSTLFTLPLFYFYLGVMI